MEPANELPNPPAYRALTCEVPQRMILLMATMPIANKASSELATPPYLPFSRFLQSLDSLAGCMPARIDRTLWSGESAYLATVLVNAYAFLRLIDENEAPTALIQRLATDTRNRPATLREVLENAYGADVVDTVAKAATAAEVHQAMAHFRVSGATHRKAVSFLLQACRYAGIPVLKELTAKSRLSHAKTAAGSPDSPIEITTITVALQSGGEVTLSGRFNPFTLSPEDRRFVFRLADELTAYKARQQERDEAVPADHEEVPF
jgi:hypothetical protein